MSARRSDRKPGQGEVFEVPSGPPLHLERPGSTTRHLTPFVAPERLARLRQVLGRRTRHLTALLERVHDVHNISACVRSCDAFGIQHLHVVAADDSQPLNRMVSTGSDRWVTIHQHVDTGTALAALRQRGYRLAATVLTPDPPPFPIGSVPLDTGPLCIIFGNERDGVSPEVEAAADLSIQIPMTGFVESLNISVAFAVTLFTLRSRLDALDPPPPSSLLTEAEQLPILDRWILRDVKRSSAIIEELARRADGDPRV